MKKEKNQKSWFRTEVDFENSFKWWFALQWQNNYIQLFLLFFSVLIFQLCHLKNVWNILTDSYNQNIELGLFISAFMLLPIAGTLIISYKGFWQYFLDIKNNKNR